jgi:hypothetical protein
MAGIITGDKAASGHAFPKSNRATACDPNVCGADCFRP